ncbi:MAG: recombination protein RecR, partial [Actinobacteria bacterium]|nr:recombination protein RecR [Actinomycetota bacterium]
MWRWRSGRRTDRAHGRLTLTSSSRVVPHLYRGSSATSSVGPKSAQRIAFHLLKSDRDEVEKLTTAIATARATVQFCERCFNFSESTLCHICNDDRRDGTTLCVVEESRDVVAIEKTGQYRGRYHVLLGAMNPLEGVGPEQLKIRELLLRLDPEGITEVILCLNPNTEGEVTNLYLARLLKPLGI